LHGFRVRTGARVPLDRRHQAPPTACSSTASSSTATAEPFKTINPATEEVLAEVAEAGAADVDRAVKAARKAYDPGLGPDAGAERAKYLFRIARIIQERSRELAVLESLDNGKPIKESRDVDVPLVAAHFFYYAGWADKLEYAGFGPDPQPLGVAGQVIPWNFPLLMLAWKIAPALACGNTVVLKPAETTPLTALFFAEICQQADLPPGVVNIVTGAGDTGRGAGRAPGRRQGRVHRLDRGRPAIAGRSPAPARSSPSSSAARPRTSSSTTRRSTRRSRASSTASSSTRATSAAPARGCWCRSRSPTRCSRKLKRRMATLRVGDPLDKNTDIGAINSRAAGPDPRAVRDRRGRGRRALVAAVRAARPQGFWFAPTIFTGVTQAHRIAREEIFGPVLSVLTFRTPDEAVEKANNTPYGLSAGIWTEKGSRILWMADKLRAGVVWANTFNKFDPTSPFGGYKESGYGREGGRHGLEAYLP
jgi:aldehyde dehydrogenase (NAD+)